MGNILETEHLSKKYGDKTVLDDVSIAVNQGGIYGLVGRNGAGKTTLMKIVGGMTNATGGTYRLNYQCDNEKDRKEQRGLLIESPGILPKQSAWDNIYIKCLAMGLKDKEEPKRLLKLVGLEEAGKKEVGKFSLGMKQRLGLAMALLGHPKFVILDEPINGFDPQGIRMVREVIQAINRQEGTTFLVSSHILDELSMIATHYGFLNKGKLLEQVESGELHTRCEKRLELLTNRTAETIPVLEQLGFENFRVMNDGYVQIYEGLERSGEITAALAKKKIAVLEIVKRFETLEDYFIRMIGKEEQA